MKSGITLAALVGLFLFSVVNGQGQSAAWKVYSPKDESFSVELPVPLKKVGAFEAEHGAYKDDEGAKERCCAYAAIENTPEESRFGIVVISKKSKGFEKVDFDNEETLSFLALTLIGDDDFDQYLRKPLNIFHNGLKGREYLYIKNDTLNKVTQYSRGRMFVTGDKIFVTVFVGKDEKDLLSPDAARFFDSLRIGLI